MTDTGDGEKAKKSSEPGPSGRGQRVDPKLLELLVCPVSHKPLRYDAEAGELISESAQSVGLIKIDPLRLMNAVITGVAFLGAGAIIRGGEGVTGLTTGASLWMSGAVGVACGGGYYVIAVLATVFAVLVLYVISLLERRLRGPRSD